MLEFFGFLGPFGYLGGPPVPLLGGTMEVLLVFVDDLGPDGNDGFDSVGIDAGLGVGIG